MTTPARDITDIVCALDDLADWCWQQTFIDEAEAIRAVMTSLVGQVELRLVEPPSEPTP